VSHRHSATGKKKKKEVENESVSQKKTSSFKGSYPLDNMTGITVKKHSSVILEGKKEVERVYVC
jgi:hypothetical protein